MRRPGPRVRWLLPAVGIVLACAGWTATILRRCGGLFSDPIPVFAALGTVLRARDSLGPLGTRIEVRNLPPGALLP